MNSCLIQDQGFPFFAFLRDAAGTAFKKAALSSDLPKNGSGCVGALKTAAPILPRVDA